MNDSVRRLLEVLEESGKRIHTLLTRLTLCENTAEDLMQELFIRMSRSESFGHAQDPTAYVIRGALNLAFEWRRKEKRTVHGVHGISYDARLASADSSPADALEAKEQATRVMSALGQISELGREVIVLHRLEGQSYESIASQLNKTPHQVRAICSKAIGQLRERLSASLSTKDESK